MRKLIKIALVALGIRAFLHWRKSRKLQASAPPSAPPATQDPADALRRKLAESREDDDATEPERAAPAEASVAERRDDVHEQGRAALDEMRSSSEA